MKILPVSEFSCKKSNLNFEAKDSTQKEQPSVVTNSIKKAVPTAALVLAMMADPVAVNKAEAATMENANTEMQWHPHPHWHPHFHPCPPPPPVYYNPYNYVLPTIAMINYLNTVALMNNVYSTPVSPVSVGGVAFNKTDIASVNAYTHDDVQYHNVVLSNGTNLTFPEQPEENYAAVYRDNSGYVFEGLSEAFIEGSDNRDKYTLNGCTNTAVDVGGDDRIDRVMVQRYRVLPNHTRQYTNNVEVTASRGDVVNNKKVYSEEETTTYSGY